MEAEIVNETDLNKQSNSEISSLPQEDSIFVAGELFPNLPEDLYIPPQALRVILDTFQGPLDLLLYLIRKQNLDILNIPVADITAQYMKYVHVMKDLNLELAGEYLVMAAILGEIKSRCLLPKMPNEDEAVEDDPRAELIRRLQAYEQTKQAAEDLAEIPRWERDYFPTQVDLDDIEVVRPEAPVTLAEMLKAMQQILDRATLYEKHAIQREELSTRARMAQVLSKVSHEGFMEFLDLFDHKEGRAGIVVTFLAVLELVKEKLIEVVQADVFGTLYVRNQGYETARQFVKDQVKDQDELEPDKE